MKENVREHLCCFQPQLSLSEALIMIMSTIVDISAIVILLQTSLYEDYNSYPGLTFWNIMESSDTRHILLRNYS